jgi:predicted Zn-dependent protease
MKLEQAWFEELSKQILSELKSGEHLNLNLNGENSQFLRFSNAKVRQLGTIEDASLDLTLIKESKNGLRKTVFSFSLSGDHKLDRQNGLSQLARARAEIDLLPVDPYAQLPQPAQKSSQKTKGSMPEIEQASELILGKAPKLLKDFELVGILASGSVVRGMLDSAGSNHWFETERFNLDYSVYAPNQKASKGCYSSDKWVQAEWDQELEDSRKTAELLNRPVRALSPGAYRTYLSPECVAFLVSMFSWYAIGERYIRQGVSSLKLAREGKKSFSPKFNLDEDFSAGRTPRFNQEGSLAPMVLPLIRSGKLKNTLVSVQSAKEFSIESNGANNMEMLRAASVHPGSLKDAEVLSRLGTGFYLSNLHYLNWSDQASGRVTGMTRFACFWVENGVRVAPIENLRFDDTLFELFGENLEELGDKTKVIPDVGTYERRSLEAASAPGALLSKMKFTL